ncbi:cupin domain-containing protein [Arcticibacter tournemirensis]|uniref:Cupin domain-containing protein n=1 Tax=Arcticibacter tournemirensis TaxID=699437 RepID=A0A4Q0M9M8_9SPHI|nr:cupin domain-containing protein [Arcticibacter tournemirensis]RXF69479.1 cupin domain-containing protein [Arcticibacter tournemirensis]
MKAYKKVLSVAFTVFCLSSFLRPEAGFAQQTGVKRTDLQKHNIEAPGYETIQARIDFEPGKAVGMHSHPGEEVIYVLEGLLEYQIDGEKAVILKAGDVLFIPAGKNHSAKNVGKVKAAELATYIVKKDKPLLVFKK